MTDNDLSPALGGQPGPTGREPGLSRLHQQRYEEMAIWELYALMDDEMRERFWSEYNPRITHLHKTASSPEWKSEVRKLSQWRHERIIEYLTGKVD
jgi:hypothetical protein